MDKILLIEDDLLTHSIVKHSLAPGYEVVSCTTLAEAIHLISTDMQISAFIIDRHLPDGDGVSMCAIIRQNNRRASCPVIFLSSAQSETDKVGAFYAGADDYITKPFSPLELKARLQARLRRTNETIFAGNIQFDLNSHRAFLKAENGETSELTLTRIEYLMLLTLIRSLDQVFSREQLLEKIWGSETHVSDRVIDSHISHLRKKLISSNLKLESLRKEGYRLSLILPPYGNQAA
jgi:DNA-binding response OmpR family regulator